MRFYIQKITMLRVHHFFLFLVLSSCLLHPDPLGAQSPDTKMQWFKEAKLGIFIHWGLYAVEGIDESWSFFNGYPSHQDYLKQIDGFTAANYDPEAWAAQDLVGPFVAALRKKDIKVGLYYSLLDWSYPDYPNRYWFDGDWEYSAEEWQSESIRTKLLRQIPQVVINSRLNNQGDYATPEQGMPMNDSWGYQSNDHHYKTSDQVIENN
ncbi:MAG TPA: alpha-L-fucosidase [Saprospiraceae bacterium]|nr:alpha-L-fucosidase [Saprospiraceae bacterium]